MIEIGNYRFPPGYLALLGPCSGLFFIVENSLYPLIINSFNVITLRAIEIMKDLTHAFNINGLLLRRELVKPNALSENHLLKI